MRVIVIRTLIAVVVLGVLWLAAGRQLTLLLDRFVTVRVASLPTTTFTYRAGSMEVGPAGEDSSQLTVFDLPVRFDDQNRATIDTDATTFVLGARTPLRDRPIQTDSITPDAGDSVSFTLARSVLGWPTPFEMNFMTGHAPSYKRNLYYRLVWKKPAGPRLEMLWRYEQWYYPGLGWSGSGGMIRDGATGLIRMNVRQ